MRSSRRNILVDVQEQVDAFSANRDYTRLVAVGCKGLMKIFATDGEGLEMVTDLRAIRSRRLNLMYFSTHASWNPNIDAMVATASPSGAVVLWNVERNTLEHAYKSHVRSATKVCFHRVDRNVLLSGAKDAAVMQYDIRAPEPVKKYLSGSYDPIRDLQMGVHGDQSEIFVAADDGGSVRFWDLRRNDRPLRQFVAHHGPASVALNPSYDDRNLVATAGRDKFIRIWKWSDWSESGTNTAIYSVETTTPVARVYWRPKNKYQVASCAALHDTNVYIWDIRRPFLPFASFDGHRDSCSDMAWKPEESESFVTGGRDGLIMLNFFENAHRPMNYVNDVAVDISPLGELAIALSSQLKLKNEVRAEEERRLLGEAVLPRRRRYDPFQSWVASHLVHCVPTRLRDSLTPQSFIFLAKNYKLRGGNFEILCEYNSRVAEKAGLHQVAQSWRLLSLLCSVSSFFALQRDSRSHSSSKQSELNGEGDTRGRFRSSGSSLGVVMRTDVDGGGVLVGAPPSLAANADFFFGDAELNIAGLSSDCLNMAISTHLDSSPSLKMEAFVPRPSSDFANALDDTCSIISEECSTVADRDFDEREASLRTGVLSVRVDANCSPPWDPLPMIQSVFAEYSDVGDVQTCVSVLIVLGEKASQILDISLQKLWLSDYIDLLERYELWATAAEVISCCWIDEIRSLSLEGTFVKLICSKCKAASAVASPYCRKCRRKFLLLCSVCEEPVHGAWGWCRGCHHGGHPQHLAEWFTGEHLCPAGCGHLCVSGR